MTNGPLAVAQVLTGRIFIEKWELITFVDPFFFFLYVKFPPTTEKKGLIVKNMGEFPQSPPTVDTA
jgi:hypothetical protein